MPRYLKRLAGGLSLAAGLLIMLAMLLVAPSAAGAAPQPIKTQTAATTAPSFTLTLELIASGLNNPVGLANAGDGSQRLFVLEQSGYVRVIKNGVLLSTPYLTLTGQVVCCGEQGLLGIAFDPDFGSNGIFYLNYTANAAGFNGDTVIARYQVANPAADTANVIAVTHLITIDQPESNHNGGNVLFGPDGYLYIGMGDGGGGNDQHGTIGNGQDPAVLLGKILRVNVRGVPTYTIPPSNPFTQTVGYRPEIWALGLRNPWRFSFDRVTGDLYIGDVGQNCWEEIDFQPASSHGGENYGWRHEEGFRQFDPNDPFSCNQPVSTLITTTKPITAYNHNFGSAVTGGYVYRGQLYPWIRGVYFYSDSGSGRIWSMEQTSPGVWVGAQKIDSPYSITAFGEDENGEVYVTDYGGGAIYRLASASPLNFAASTKQVSAATAQAGDMLTYTIAVRNTGVPISDTVRVTDTIPAGLSYVAGSLTATRGAIDASAAPTLKWSGVMSNTAIVTITYRVLVTARSDEVVTNTATVDPALNPPFTRSAVLTISGPNLSGSTKLVSANSAQPNEVLTYTIVLRNSGAPFTDTVRVTDTLPTGLAYVPGSLMATSGLPDDAAAPVLKWSGVMSTTPAITVTYAVTVTTSASEALTNNAIIHPGYDSPFMRSVTVIANPYQLFLPVILRTS